MGLSRNTKQKIEIVVDVTKTLFHWGFLPTVLFLGFKKGAEPGMPPLALVNLLW